MHPLLLFTKYRANETLYYVSMLGGGFEGFKPVKVRTLGITFSTILSTYAGSTPEDFGESSPFAKMYLIQEPYNWVSESELFTAEDLTRLGISYE